ncbi:hypothetical protein L3073_02810 [Ancylomarina sp. DW003]|nr:hypothetical protein [Ancylomarina sp. DW003]MDE5421133.1 hypothetical protein [Ancylomarina sp. DW003]
MKKIKIAVLSLMVLSGSIICSLNDQKTTETSMNAGMVVVAAGMYTGDRDWVDAGMASAGVSMQVALVPGLQAAGMFGMF